MNKYAELLRDWKEELNSDIKITLFFFIVAAICAFIFESKGWAGFFFVCTIVFLGYVAKSEGRIEILKQVCADTSIKFETYDDID